LIIVKKTESIVSKNSLTKFLIFEILAYCLIAIANINLIKPEILLIIMLLRSERSPSFDYDSLLIDISNSHYKNWFFESAAVGGTFKKPILVFAAPMALQTPKLVS